MSTLAASPFLPHPTSATSDGHSEYNLDTPPPTRSTIEEVDSRQDMFGLYDVVSSVTVGSAFVLCVLATPVITPQLHPREALVYYWFLWAAQCATVGCAFLLTCLPARWRYRLSVYRGVMLLTVWSVYVYRDILPLATYGKGPMDAVEGNILWAKILLLTFAAIVLPLISPRHPTTMAGDQSTPSPEQTASIFSLVTYSWLDPLIHKAQQKTLLPVEEMPDLADYNSMNHLAKISYDHVDPIRTRGNRMQGDYAVAWGLTHLFRKDLTIMAAMVVLASASSFLVPLGLKHILAYVERGPGDDPIRPWVWLLALLFGSMAVSMSMQFYHYVSTQVVARTQAILTSAIYDHALRMRSSVDTSGSTERGQNGKVQATGPTSTRPNMKAGMPNPNNLITVDLTNVTNASTFVLLILLETPIQTILSVYFLYTLLGWSAFVGMAVTVIFFPIPTILSKRTKSFQSEKSRKTDKRTSLVVQMLATIRTTKLLGWEENMENKVEDARKEELHAVGKVVATQIWIGCINVCIPLLIMLASYTTFTFAMQRDLSASVVFSSISLFEILRQQLNLIFFRVPIVTNGQVSLKRISRFLRDTELLDSFTDPSPPRTDESRTIKIENAHFTWSSDLPKTTFTLKIDGKLEFYMGGLNVIHGPTGSGKTSLLMALLGEMHYIPTGPGSSMNLPHEIGMVAYSAQEPWILSDTVKANVVFGADYDESRFKKVMHAVDFEQDLDDFPAAENTVVGERGVTLSGGQKARLSLARAVYSQAKILFLDDVLSALDTTTIRHIVKHCFLGGLLVDRTVLLVTNNVNAVMGGADWHVELGPDGIIKEYGSKPASSTEWDMSHLDSPIEGPPTRPPYAADSSKPASGEQLPQSIKADKDEESVEGHVGWKPLMLLFGSMSARPVLYWVVLIGSFFMASGALTAQVWLLGVWADQYVVESMGPGPVLSRILASYVALVILAMLTEVLSHYMHLWGSLRASRDIHKRLMGALLGATIHWLDTTPTSRVISRCTGDIGAIDGQIPTFLLKLLELSTAILLRLILVAIVAPVFTVGVMLVALIGGLIARVYMRAQLPVKREQSNTRAPLIGTLSLTITGLVSVRAYRVEERYRRKMWHHIDRWTAASNTFYNLNRWVIVRADLIGTMFTVCLAAYLTYFSRLNASNIGFSLNMAIAFSSKVFEWIRNINAFEVGGTSLERVQYYLYIEQEKDIQTVKGDGVDDGTWPQSGELNVSNLRSWYSYSNTDVIKNVSFGVKSGERIGIVGRTGSGKSTLLLAILRCVRNNIDDENDNSGTVTLSGRSVASVPLSRLRQAITIIPQSPELFAGTIGENIDPFGKYTEDELQIALCRAQGLSERDVDAPKRHLQLSKMIASQGSNISAGERQVVALARAIVRNSKLLLMDEATSSIDPLFDDMIQRALQQLQREQGTTVLTVAHRLTTIKDYDKVLVLADGEMVEFGERTALMHNKDSQLRRLIESAPKVDRDALFASEGIPPEPSSSRSP